MRSQQGASGRKQPRQPFAKREVGVTRGQQSNIYTDRQVIPVRAAGAGVGIGGLAYAVPRLKQTKGIIAAGARSPNHNIADLSRSAGYLREGVEWVSRPLGVGTRNVLSSTNHGAYWLRAPRNARLLAATLGSGALLRAARPVHQDRERIIR